MIKQIPIPGELYHVGYDDDEGLCSCVFYLNPNHTWKNENPFFSPFERILETAELIPIDAIIMYVGLNSGNKDYIHKILWNGRVGYVSSEAEFTKVEQIQRHHFQTVVL